MEAMPPHLSYPETRTAAAAAPPRPVERLRSHRRAHRRRLVRGVRWALVLAALLPLLGTSPRGAMAAVGDSQAVLFLGTTTFTVEGLTTFGTVFGGNFGLEIDEDLLWTIGGSFAATDGEEVVTDAAGNQQVVELDASTAALRTGLLLFFNREPSSVLVPFVGGGLSFLNYDLRFAGTTVGEASGSGPGVFGSVGAELRLTRSTTLILQLGAETHVIETEAGERTNLTSGGLTFSLRIRA